MSDVHLTYATDDDWACLYINGTDTGPCQNHSLDLYETLQSLKGKTIVSIDSIEVDSEEGMAEWMGGRGFPYNLSDIPQEARS